MKERILEIIKFYNLSSSQFASKIGIQRSAVSHILSGRNKPSLDLILKILDKFPEINTDWLILGKGEMLKVGNESNYQAKRNVYHEDDSSIFDLVEEKDESKKSETDLDKDESNKKSPETTVTEDDNSIEKIIFFFKNGKFKIYLP